MEEYKPTKLAFQRDMKYHVFLNFRGEDVRKTLVDHLFEDLSAAGLNVFLDSDKLEKGKEIWPSLERAIESSAIRIRIFSKGYADSPWCLKEAAAMLRTPGLIIPLFYHVHPTHVRHPEKDSSPYKQSFLIHYGHSDRYPREEIDEWKDALVEICKRSGWSADITQGYEARLVKMVVSDLVKTFDRVQFEVAKHPVGIVSVKNVLIQKLNLNSVKEVVKVGIWGIGGIGKTTVAKAVYNQIYTDFEAASFLFNVGTAATESRGLTNLQQKILKDLSKYGGEVDSVDEGISLLRYHLRGKSVLLILDDVDAVVQLNALLGDWLNSGSRVIITSRDKHILNVAQISSECIHKVSGLELNESLQLFNWHASPSPEYKELSKKIVEACKGHPLSLEVIGSFLSDKEDDKNCWIEALHNIPFIPEIHQKLYSSYSALSDEEKEIFLDIACFFIGEEKTAPIVFWKSLYRMVDTALSNLSMKLLIKIDDEGLFDMPDHFRDMGRSIANKDKKGTRLWEAAHLSTISNTNFSRLRLSGGNLQSLEMLYRPSLWYLHLENVHVEGMTTDTLAMLPPSLRWLRLEKCHFAFGMNSASKKPCYSRSVNNIGLSLEKHYFDFGMDRERKKSRYCRFVDNMQLKTLQIHGCNDIDSVSVASLFSLANIQLQLLDLECCLGLNNLPDTIGNLSQLQHLDLRGYLRLNNLSDAIGNLSQLKYMDLGLCYDLNNLPDSIGNLSQLQHLNLEWCDGLKNLPVTIGNLARLQNLKLERV